MMGFGLDLGGMLADVLGVPGLSLQSPTEGACSRAPPAWVALPLFLPGAPATLLPRAPLRPRSRAQLAATP